MAGGFNGNARADRSQHGRYFYWAVATLPGQLAKLVSTCQDPVYYAGRCGPCGIRSRREANARITRHSVITIRSMGFCE